VSFIRRRALEMLGVSGATVALLTGCFLFGSKTPEVAERKLGVTGAGSSLERVTSDPVTEVHPAISPSGDILLFEVRVYEQETCDAMKQQTLVGVNPSTRAQRTLFTSTNGLAAHPAWLPDQSSYVYASTSPGDWSLVRALTAAPNAAVNVIATGEIAPSASWPTVSPDGKRVAFSADVRGTTTIAVVGLDGSRFTLLGEGQSPAWSPGGEALAFARRVGAYLQLFTVDPTTGTGLVQLTSGDFDHNSPAWSPDGKYLVFSSNAGWNKFTDGSPKRISNLYIINRDGTGLTQATEGNSLNADPNWGRDGWIYFASNQSGNMDIWRVRPGGAYANLQPPTEPSEASSEATPTEPAPPASAEPTAPAPSSGCSKDADCKGERICESGVCVDPKPKK
jgi:Tol biopolymer transport system component